MNSTQALIRRDDAALTISFTEAAIALKSHALEVSALVGRVHDAATQEAAVAAQQEIQNVLSGTEKARKSCKEPILEYGRRIDEAAKMFTQELKEEQLRIGRLVGEFQEVEAAKARAAEQLRIEEERKVQEERRQAELAAMRAAALEREKMEQAQRELARQEAEAKSARERQILAEQQAEIERQRQLAEAKSHEELDRINREASNRMHEIADQPKYEPIRTAGQRVADDWDIVVSDIWLLAKAHPSCVKITALPGEIKTLTVSTKPLVSKVLRLPLSCDTMRSARASGCSSPV